MRRRLVGRGNGFDRQRSGRGLRAFRFAGYGIIDVVHAPTCRTLERNCALVQELCYRPVRGVCGKRAVCSERNGLNEVSGRGAFG